MEPETVVNEMSVVVVDEHGDFIRRRIGGPKGIDAVAKLLQCDVYDVEETGTPTHARADRARTYSAQARRTAPTQERFEREHGRAKDNPNDPSA